jgi:hypothetical protein
MPSLVDITPLTIDVAGIPIKGISGRSIGVLLNEFPVFERSWPSVPLTQRA